MIGIRAGEKLHEEMVTASDSQNTIENDRYYVIVPMLHDVPYEKTLELFMEHHKAKTVEPNFCYSSERNHDWLNVEQIRELIVKHVDPGFKI